MPIAGRGHGAETRARRGRGGGGWKTVQTLKAAYQQADADTMLRVVLKAGELREAK